MKRFAAVLFVILVSVSFAGAEDGIVTWTWYENDPGVEYYRYQIDAQEPDRWTVVDWSVTEVSVTLDVSVVHTLYLQQSYDGILWSGSSSTDSEVFVEEEPQPAEEPLTTGEPEPEEEFPEEPVIEEPEPVEETVAEVAVEEGFKPLSQLDMGFCYMNFIPDPAGNKAVGVAVSYSRTFAEAGVFGFGIKAGLSANVTGNVFHGTSGNYVLTKLDVLGLISAGVGRCDIYFALGPGACFAAGDDGYFTVGIAAEAGVRYHRTDKLAFGLELADKQYLSDRAHVANMMEMGAYVSLSL
jgi:hypothetical protein